MDANGLRSYALRYNAGFYGWRFARADGTKVPTIEEGHEQRCSSARLINQTVNLSLRETAHSAAQIKLLPAAVRDRAGNYLWWDAVAGVLWSVSHLRDRFPELAPVAIDLPAGAKPVRDLALTSNDVLWIAGGVGLWMFDLRARFPAFLVALPDDFVAHRIAAAADDSVFILDAAANRIARVRGMPLPIRGVDVLKETNTRFEATELNADAPRVQALDLAFDGNERAVALACSADGTLAILSVMASGGAFVSLLTSQSQRTQRLRLHGPRFPHSIGWLNDETLAFLTDAQLMDDQLTPQPHRDVGVLVYPFPKSLQGRLAQNLAQNESGLYPVGDYYPTARALKNAPFANVIPGDDGGQRYRLFYARTGAKGVEIAPVARVSMSQRGTYGVIANFEDTRRANVFLRNVLGVIDSGDLTTVWHRLFVEARVPPGTAALVWLSANDNGPPAFDPTRPQARAHWFPHLIGDVKTLPAEVAAALPTDIPRAQWIAAPSEVPLGQSLLNCPLVEGVTGMFDVLIQCGGLTTRRLTGRRLWMTMELFGDGQQTPEIVTARVYAGRISYRDRYLPALYHEQLFGEEAARKGRATGADFLERFIHLFEGVFTGIEDRIKYAHLMSDAFGTPPDALPWLAAWVGLTLDPGIPERRKRWMIANASRLAARRGTLEGLKLALDIATDGAVTRGRIVVLENYRLRRTMATILGAYLADHQDALTGGIAQSGNSFVGDTLILGDDHVKTFLALFRDLHLDAKASDTAKQKLLTEQADARAALYDGLAYRATVLVHEQMDADELRIVKKLADAAAPAHVQMRVHAAAYPFLVAVASLVGADTYLRTPEEPGAVTVERSRLGYLDTLQGLGGLDALHDVIDDTLSSIPAARAAIVGDHDYGNTFQLDGSASTAAPGRYIKRYRWRLLPPGTHAPDE